MGAARESSRLRHAFIVACQTGTLNVDRPRLAVMFPIMGDLTRCNRPGRRTLAWIWTQAALGRQWIYVFAEADGTRTLTPTLPAM